MELTGIEKVAEIGAAIWLGGSLLFGAGYSIYRKLSKKGNQLPPLVRQTIEEEPEPIAESVNNLSEEELNKKRTEMEIKHTLDILVADLDNKKVGQIFYNKITPKITSYSDAIERAKTDFEQFEGGILPNMFKVFDSFTQDSREIYPSETVHKLIDNGQELYLMLKDKVIRGILSSVLNNSSDSEDDKSWKIEFGSYLKDTLSLAEDSAYWIKRLSKREDIVGKKIRERLRDYGINQPARLPYDVKKLGNNIIKLFIKLDCLPEDYLVTNSIQNPELS